MTKVKYIAICAVVSMAVGMTSGCGVPKNEHEVLEKKYAKVQLEMKGFNSQAKKVQKDNEVLTKKVKALETEAKKISKENAEMKKKTQALLKEKEALEKKLKEAVEKKAE